MIFNNKAKQISPRITINFLGLTIRIPKLSILKERRKNLKYYQSFKSAIEIPKATGNLRLIQEANTTLLKTFDELCTKYNFNYWLDFGTLLGAVRHKGFIPWDDDLDVSMPRSDYERFTSQFKDIISDFPDLKLVIGSNNKNKRLVKLKHKSIHRIGIDIFPYDYYHSQLTEKEKQILSLKISKCLKTRIFTRFNTDEAIRSHFREVTDKFILKGINGNPENKPAIFMAIDFPHRWKNKVYDWENIFPLQKIEFEGHSFSAPNDQNKVLTSVYGNYMEIPKDSYPRHTAYLDISKEQLQLLEEYSKN